MKRFFALVLALCALLAPAGCSGSPAGPEGPYHDGELTYSNLVGKAVQEEVRAVLLAAGVSSEDVDTFFVWVDDFNQAMGDCPSYRLQDAFTTVQAPAVDYGEYGPMSRTWYKTNGRDYGDVLCRIAAFHLAKDSIRIASAVDRRDWACYTEDQWLYSDWEAISTSPLIEFSEEETEDYFTLYNPVSAAGKSLSAEEMYQAVLDAWQERAVAFTEGPISLVTVWRQWEDQIAAAHAAVLVQNGEALLLVEKTNPQSPYQATKFSTLEQVRQYMYESIHQEDLRYGDETGTLIVLRNDTPLE